MRPCYSFAAASADNKPPTLSIFDEIGFWGVQAKEFLASLAAVEGPTLDVEISSPGGDVFAAVAMYNGLRASGKEITTRVMGVAASAASLVFMAGDKRVMPKNTHLMVHNPWSFAAGNAAELRDTADFLDKIGTTVRSTYAVRSGMDDAAVAELLSKDTWLTADEAMSNGMATEVTEEVRANASFNMDRADLPEHVKAVYLAAKQVVKPPVNEPVVDTIFAESVSALAKEAGLETYAPLWALACATLDQVQERVTCAKQINALCALTSLPEQSDILIKANKTIAEAKATLVEIKAQADEATHTDTTKKVDMKTQTTRTNAKPTVTPANLWASHNAQSKK